MAEQPITRREFFAAFVPGSGAKALLRAEGFGSLTPGEQLAVAVDLVYASVLTPTMLGCSPKIPEAIPSATNPESFKDQITKFSWEDLNNSERLSTFTRVAAQKYLDLTHSPNLKIEDLTGSGKTNFYYRTTDYTVAVKKEVPDYSPSATSWGYTNFATENHFIDIESLRKQSEAAGVPAGAAILDALWHEWTHSDVRERQQGDLINNPDVGFQSPVSGEFEM